ncbi:MAG: hypothetical protein ACRCXT_19430 [Paraclostridium sp.]
MISVQVVENQSKVYIKVEGYVSSNDVKVFTSDYKSKIKGIKTNRYHLVIEPNSFDCENDKDIKNACMMFYKTGYKKIYLIDPQNYIMSNIKLGPLEKKMFLSAVKILKSQNEIR